MTRGKGLVIIVAVALLTGHIAWLIIGGLVWAVLAIVRAPAPRPMARPPRARRHVTRSVQQRRKGSTHGRRK